MLAMKWASMPQDLGDQVIESKPTSLLLFSVTTVYPSSTSGRISTTLCAGQESEPLTNTDMLLGTRLIRERLPCFQILWIPAK
jgi:hypothetical protein